MPQGGLLDPSAVRATSTCLIVLPAATQAGEVQTKPTKPYDGQKAGTSGLRKKTDVFMQENYLANWVQSLFLALESLGDEIKGKDMGLGGDGRYFNKEAVQIILKLAAGARTRSIAARGAHCSDGQAVLVATSTSRCSVELRW